MTDSSTLCAFRRTSGTFLAWLENPELEDAPVIVEIGSVATVFKNSAPLRIGDKVSKLSRGEVSIEIEDTQQAVLVPTAEKRNGRSGERENGR